eukprot:g6467.t1
MRIMIKGGVWKNTEDEILKAAVMKYGLNQWARISSLLTRKSAKQCKARWYEWLDPEIKKTEWTKEEDEKLLHLAKLFPTQWRTIAPIVGRTSAQCLERYEKLLDLALSKDESYDPDDDPRRLRPGEIDPNPESKPARPDPVDMDEDEKEMLSEARARLANTRGKKAKRKAREKQLEEARRLAFMQKNRELKAAGIELRHRDRIRRGLNYNVEVAFEKKPPIGFFDTSEEQERTKEVAKQFRPASLQQMEGKRRKDVEEALMKQDIRRHKILSDHDQPSAVAKESLLNQTGMNRRRSKLILPEPQVSEQELIQISKTGSAMQIDEELTEGAGGEVTRKLLGQYDQTPSTVIRTPRTQLQGGDRVLQEAHNLAKMQTAETPLLGRENPELYPSDFTGVVPRRDQISTPNPLVGPLGTPWTAQGTPMRDELGLNAISDSPSVASGLLGGPQGTLLRNQLRAQLAQLPEAKNKAEIEIPELPSEDDEEQLTSNKELELDAVELEALKKAAEQAEADRLFRLKSKSIQRGLPRPLISNWHPPNQAKKQNMSLLDQAEIVLTQEVFDLLHRDSITDPIDKKSKKRKKKGTSAPVLDEFSESELNEAAKLLEKEAEFLQSKMDMTPEEWDELHAKAWTEGNDQFIWIPSQSCFGREASASVGDKLQSVKERFQTVRTEMEKEAKRAQKLEEKVKRVCSGHWTRQATLQSTLNSTWFSLQQEEIDLKSYRNLQASEESYAKIRLQELKEMVTQQRDLEKQLQLEYKRLYETDA